MVDQFGDIWWASLPEPSRSEPGHRRPLVIGQSNDFSQSRIQTVLAAVIASNIRLARAPGNALLPAKRTGLSRDSNINVSQLITVNKTALTENTGRMTGKQLQEMDEGLRLVLAL